jgi:hypothetical protein
MWRSGHFVQESLGSLRFDMADIPLIGTQDQGVFTDSHCTDH